MSVQGTLVEMVISLTNKTGDKDWTIEARKVEYEVSVDAMITLRVYPVIHQPPVEKKIKDEVIARRKPVVIHEVPKRIQKPRPKVPPASGPPCNICASPSVGSRTVDDSHGKPGYRCRAHCGFYECTVIDCLKRGLTHTPADANGPGGPRCYQHGGGRGCNVPGCGKFAQTVLKQHDLYGSSGPRCIKHGGGTRCTIEGCGKTARGQITESDLHGPPGSRCKRHGGGRRCNVPECTSSYAGTLQEEDEYGPAGPRCKTHGAGTRCSISKCNLLSVGSVEKTDNHGEPGPRCRKHGGAVVCDVRGCNRIYKSTRIFVRDIYGPPGIRCSRHLFNGTPEVKKRTSYDAAVSALVTKTKVQNENI